MGGRATANTRQVTETVADLEEELRVSTKHKKSNNGVAIGSVFLCLCALVRALHPSLPPLLVEPRCRRGGSLALRKQSNGCPRCTFSQRPLSTVLHHAYVVRVLGFGWSPEGPSIQVGLRDYQRFIRHMATSRPARAAFRAALVR